MKGSIKLGQIAFVEKGIYDVETTYKRFHFVTTGDSTYLSLVDDNVGNPLTDTASWLCLADGKPALAAAANAIIALNDANAAIEILNTFLSAHGASDAIINTWKEVEAFLEGVTDTETLEGLLLEQKQTITNERNTALESYSKGGNVSFFATENGWHRIASFPSGDMAGVCTIINDGTSDDVAAVIFTFNGSKATTQAQLNSRAAITQLGGSTNCISKARVICGASGECFLEIYYCGAVEGNNLHVHIANSDSAMMIAGTAGSIPTGYFAKEVLFYNQAITAENVSMSGMIIITAGAMEAHIGQASAVTGSLPDTDLLLSNSSYSSDSRVVLGGKRDPGFINWNAAGIVHTLRHSGNSSGSDKRLKNILKEPINWKKILGNTNPVFFKWKNKREQDCSVTGNEKKLGYLAQNIYEYAPWMVGKNRYNGKFDNFEEAQMIPLLHLAHLDNVKRISDLEEQNKALIKRLEALENR